MIVYLLTALGTAGLLTASLLLSGASLVLSLLTAPLIGSVSAILAVIQQFNAVNKTRRKKHMNERTLPMTYTASLENQVRELQEELKTAQSLGPWKPIETAPKDESQILLFLPSSRWGNPKVTVGVYDPDLEAFFDYESDEVYPTSWMPLPCPPKVKE